MIHPGEVKTTMWSYIREKTMKAIENENKYSDWVSWVERTGGDPPEKAAQLVLDIIEGNKNGCFLWIENPLQKPIPSWNDED